MSRPKKDLPVNEIERMASRGLTEEQIALALGVAYSTLRRHKSKNEQIQAAIKRGKAIGVLEISNTLFETAKAGNVTAMIFYLKTRSPDEWRDKQNVSASVDLDGKIQDLIDRLPN